MPTDLKDYAREWSECSPLKAVECVLENILQAEYPLKDDIWVVGIESRGTGTLGVRIMTCDTGESFTDEIHNATPLSLLVRRNRLKLESLFRESWSSVIAIKEVLPATKHEINIQPAALAAL